MLELAFLFGFGFLAFRASRKTFEQLDEIPRKIGDRLTALWNIAHEGMRQNKLLRAEKALLTILKIDQKNAAAYNRLGILYAKQKEYKDAIDCFEIASSIEPSPSSLHNLGLIYFETEHYEKAAMAFEQALKLEDGLAARHIAYAKVQEKLGNDAAMFTHLHRAVELETNKETLSLLHKAYEVRDMHDEAKAIQKKLDTLIVPAGKPRRILRPKKVVV